MKQTIILMCGIPASGKTSHIKGALLQDKVSAAHISRDETRKSFVGEDADANQYFSREDEVFEQFVNAINSEVAKGTKRIYVDATHISIGSREKILTRINNRKKLNLEVVVLSVDLATAQARNLNRTGFARVPRSAIYNMAKGFKMPTEEELAQFKFKSVNIKGV